MILLPGDTAPEIGNIAYSHNHFLWYCHRGYQQCEVIKKFETLTEGYNCYRFLHLDNTK